MAGVKSAIKGVTPDTDVVGGEGDGDTADTLIRRCNGDSDAVDARKEDGSGASDVGPSAAPEVTGGSCSPATSADDLCELKKWREDGGSRYGGRNAGNKG